MKVLYPILHYPPVIGGLEQWSQNIAERQPKDIKVFIVTGRVKGETTHKTIGNLTILRTSLFELKDMSHSSMIYIATAVPFIVFCSLMLAKKNKIALFHCHGFVSALMGYALSFLTGKPFIGTEQSIGWAHGVAWLLRSVVYKKAALVIGASQAVLEEFKKLGVTNCKIVPNGVDLDTFTSDVGYRKSHIILSVGRLEKIKGHTYLIEAFARVKKEIPDARLILVGDGSERESLEEQVSRLGLLDVEFTGEIPHDKLPHWYHAADVFVMPSLSEGFGITAIEAMASGVPVVATSTGSLREIIFDGKTGILVDSKQREAISRAIIRIFKDKDFAAQLGENGKKRAAEFDWRTSAEKVYRIYQSVI